MRQTYSDLRFDDYCTGGAAEQACWDIEPARLCVAADWHPAWRPRGEGDDAGADGAAPEEGDARR